MDFGIIMIAEWISATSGPLMRLLEACASAGKLTGRDTAKWEPSRFFKVIRMSTKRLYLVMLVLVIGCQSRIIGSVSQSSPALPAKANGAPAEAKPDEQLEINRNTLLQGPSEEIRIKAATVMLFGENPLARKFLLDALKQTENNAARMAICKALIQARSSKESVKNKEDFIQPLLGIFATEIAAEAQLAAEATLIFEYDKIGESLEKVVTDGSKPVKTRLNAIHALKLRPDMMATIRLIKLVDDPEKQVAAEAENALRSLGIPVGENSWIRQKNILELQSKGRDEFQREWIERQEAQMRKMQIESKSWQDRYLSALDKMYNGISDDTARGEFLDKYLRDTEAVVRLWALEKVRQWRVAPGTSKLPPKLEPILVNLISDQDTAVRLKTAKLLSLMGELNSAQRLLAQLETEQNDQVKTELFVALGGACYYAFLPDSPVKIPNEIRTQTLEWAVKYLSGQEPKGAQTGAEVMKKLLEQDGLETEEVDRHLGLLAERYNRETNKPNGALRGELLSAMAGLCAQGSACKAKAAKLFKPLFEAALRDEADFVREAAVAGLIHIDETNALKILRNDFVNDPSSKVREKLIDLAGKIGGREDLTWLAEKIGSNSESKLAWQAMLKIFDSSDTGVLDNWIDKFTSQSSKTKLSDEQKIAFLEMADGKAVSENKSKMLKNVRERLAELYYKIGQYERAADYSGRLYEAAPTTKEKDAILPDLLDAYLRWPNAELAAKLVQNRLLAEDLDPNDVVVRSIDNYLSKPPAGADPNAVLQAVITKIKATRNRPKWAEQKKRWADRLGKAKGSDKPKEGGN
ncbi:MAG: HEAT repeat domain-containing protein [Planctomycetota bacterium]